MHSIWKEIFLMIQDLKNAINEASVISFDIFDTLVVRPFLRPIDLFLQIENDYSIDGFFQERLDVELFLRERIIQSGLDVEITYNQIYDEMPSKYKYLKNIEIAYELKYCIPNEIILNLYRYAVKQNKIILISSDMYLPKEVIEKILVNINVIFYNKLYLSNDLKVSKADSSTFDMIKSDFNHIKSEHILHIGDNYSTDYINAIQSNIKAYHVDNIHDVFKKSHSIFSTLLTNSSTQNDLEFSKIFGFLAIEYSKKNYFNDLDKIISQFIFPIVLSFNKYIINFCKKNQIKKILFASRDGYIFKEFHDCFFHDDTIISEKFFISRRAVTVPTLDFSSLTDCSIFAQGMEGSTALEIWNNFEIEDEYLKNEFILLSDDSNISYKDILSMLKTFFDLHADKIKHHYERERKNILSYLESIGYFSSSVVVIELGWKGSLQNAINKIGENSNKNLFPKWLYLGTRDDIFIDIKKDAFGHLVHEGYPNKLQEEIRFSCNYIELLFGAPNYSVKTVKLNSDNEFEPVYFASNKEEEKRIDINRKIHENCLYIGQLYKKYHENFLDMKVENVQTLLHEYIVGINGHTTNLFMDIKVSENFQNTNYKNIMPPMQSILTELEQTRADLIERTETLEQTRADLIERTRRLEDTIAELDKYKQSKLVVNGKVIA